MEFGGKIILPLLIEHHAVLHPGTTAALDEEPQRFACVFLLLGQKRPDVISGIFRQGDNKVIFNHCIHNTINYCKLSERCCRVKHRRISF